MTPKLILLPHHKKLFDKLSQSEKAEMLDALMQFLNLQEVTPFGNPVLDILFTVLTADVKTEDKRKYTSANNGKKHTSNLNKKIGSESDLGSKTEDSLIDNKNIIKEEIINKGNNLLDINIRDNNNLSNDKYIIPKEENKEVSTIVSTSSSVSREKADEKKPSKESPERIDFHKLLDYFNTCMQGKAINPIKAITDRRKIHIVARAREFGKSAIMTVIEKAAASNYLNGHHGGRAWKADFDWLFLPTKFPKILEGKYDNDNNTSFASPHDADDTILRPGQMDYSNNDKYGW